MIEQKLRGCKEWHVIIYINENAKIINMRITISVTDMIP